ncbi:MAG: NAD(P)-dependent oxidoreductase [Actinobacteria bacterium]|nr:NAD(P)-dependent oxidoreductase [Actinomycetota bacterium]
MKVGFCGLGVMGSPMARHLASKSHEVVVYNRNTEKAKQWVDKNGGKFALTPREVGEQCDVVMVCVGNDDDVRSVVFGAPSAKSLSASSKSVENGLLAGLKPGTVLVDHTTASATLARELSAACSAKNVGFIDAPVSGGQAGAENGALTVMCGCDDQKVFDRVRPVFDAYAKACQRMGDAGAGQLTKMVNQICIAGVVSGLAEALNFAMRAGLDADQVVEVISKGAAQSWQMENRSKTMVRDQFDFGFAVEWMRKDLGICFDEAKNNGADLTMTKLVDALYARVIEMGGSRWDTSSLMKLLTHPKK